MVNPTTPDELFLFVHVPKTGGQTMRAFFERSLVFHREFIHLGPWGIRRAQDLGLLPFERRPLEERHQARVILGHDVTRDTHALVPGKIARYVVFFRDPAEALVSYYNFQMEYYFRKEDKPIIGFDEWYDQSKRGNVMITWFYANFMKGQGARVTGDVLREVNAVLERFWFVGCTETLDQDGPLLLRTMGIPGELSRVNVSGVHHPKLLTLDATLRRRLLEDNPIDYELYTHWKGRLEASRRRLHGARDAARPSGAS